jgi:hypothetical protein
MLKALLLPLFLAATSLLGQAPTTPPPAPVPNTAQPIWRCTLAGGSYEVAVRAIIAVSSHEYVVDTAARVTEVNIDTAGSMLARFYFIEPNTPGTAAPAAATIERAQQITTEVATRTGTDAWKKVVKNYPATTHARTVEYRVSHKEQLQQILASAQESFRQGRSGSIAVTD